VDQLEEAVLVAANQAELLSVVEHGHVIAVTPRPDLGDSMEVHGRRAMDAHETRRVQVVEDFAQRNPDVVCLCTNVDTDSLVVGRACSRSSGTPR